MVVIIRGEMKLLFVKCGAAQPDMAARCGDYEEWFRRGMPGVLWDSVCAYASQFRAPDARDYAGVLVSGSPASVTRPEPWMEEVAALVRAGAECGTPVLGVCFGHQLIAWALGGTVRKNPSGWELGTTEIDLCAAGRADPLFAGLDQGTGRLHVNETHEDAVCADTLPAFVRVLARNAATPVQALAYGDHVRGVQFHPEVTGPISREYCLRRVPVIGAEAARALADAATDTPAAERVLANFVDRFCRKA
jgi:GMP synthase (glutamine-hydrolysing)